jgi:DNA-binding GntR family transcriptional regulator
MTEDAMISLLSAATRIACRRMTPEHLNALHASVERASCLSAGTTGSARPPLTPNCSPCWAT